ncbi:MAG: hypothetical protein JNL05_11800, partial [Flavobacteriales bacterium]|nr:hypothetical protein [Flavobacteriales bacterium]
PDSVDLIVGVTDQDISITKYDAEGKVKEPVARYRDFGIYGLGYMGGPSCVVSTFRLGAGGTLFARLAKVVVHEVGHTRGLPHCADTLCVMRDAVERMSTVDGAGRRLCARCRDLLR